MATALHTELPALERDVAVLRPAHNAGSAYVWHQHDRISRLLGKSRTGSPRAATAAQPRLTRCCAAPRTNTRPAASHHVASASLGSSPEEAGNPRTGTACAPSSAAHPTHGNVRSAQDPIAHNRHWRGPPRARRTGRRDRRSPRPANCQMHGSRICPPLPAYRGTQPFSPECAVRREDEHRARSPPRKRRPRTPRTAHTRERGVASEMLVAEPSGSVSADPSGTRCSW
jgi:hypothetical protein